VVQAADADSLFSAAQGAFAAAATMVPPLVDPVITSITLTGAGDGHMFFFELEMAAGADVDGGADVVGTQFLLSATAEDLQEQIAALQSGQPILDVQIAGSAKGQRVMALVLFGTVRPSGGGAAPFVVLAAPAPVPLTGGSDQIPLTVLLSGGALGAIVLDGFELQPGGTADAFYEVIWSAALSLGPGALAIQLVQDPTNFFAQLIAEGITSNVSANTCAVVKVIPGDPPGPRTIRFVAVGGPGVDLVRCQIMIRRITS
jgi:hypothetical protein